MRRIYPGLLLTLSFTACGPGKATTGDTTGDTTASPTAGPTTGTPGTPGTSDPTTTATTAPPTTTTTGETTTTTTGEPGETQCQVDADCFLHADCCTCEGLPIGVDHDVCDGECDQSRCEALGIDRAVCRVGVCETERLSCGTNEIVCDAPPPACPPDHLPETTPQCWTGECVPANLCDIITDCAACPPHMMCVQNVSFVPHHLRCEPIPPACDGVPDCDCAGELVCTEPFSICSTDGPIISCECIKC